MGQLKIKNNNQFVPAGLGLAVDQTPTSGSLNPVTSGGTKTALDGKQDTLTFDTTPTSGSTNPVTSNGIHEYVNEKCAWGQITGVLSNQTDLNTALSGKYVKPSGGIPDSDIASASVWSGKYTKPSGGIPDSDIASAQTWNAKQGVTDNAGYHNSVYRGANLGTINSSNIASFLSSHNVSSGQFTDLFVGDKITIQDGTYNATWLIAGFDTEWNKGDTAMQTHHISLIPETHLLYAQWHASGTPQGYWNSDIRATCDTIANNLANALGSHLLTRRILPSTAVSTSGTSMAGAGLTGYASSWAWQSTRCNLLTEVQVYGSTVCSSSFYDTGDGYEKLPLFNYIQPCTRAYWWLRGVASSSSACVVSTDGVATSGSFAYSLAVRPLVTIG